MDTEQRIAYTQRLLIGAALKKYKAVLTNCKDLAKEIAGDKWNLVDVKALST